MKYKRQLASGIMAVVMLTGGTLAFAETANTTSSKMGQFKA